MRVAATLLLLSTTLSAAPAFASGPECVAELKDVVSLSLTSGPLHMESTVSSPLGEVVMTGDMVPPKGLHTKVTTAGNTIEMITLDGKAWMQMAGTWTEMGPEMAAQMAAGFEQANAGQLDAATAVECLGTQNVEGQDLLAFSYSLDQAGAATQNRIYADPSTKRPVRIESDVETGGVTSKVLVTYTYDPSITISAPAL